MKYPNIIAFFLSCLLITVSSASIALAEQAPKVSAQFLGNGTVLVTIKSKTNKSAKIVVSKALGSSNKFKPYLNFSVRGKQTISFTEQVNAGVAKIRYRSRATGKASSAWSRPATVEISNPGDNTPDEDNTAEPENPPAVPETPEEPSNQTPSVQLPAGASACPRSEVLKVYDLVNSARASNGLAAVTEHSALALSSQVFSAKMATTQDFSHDGWYENILKSGYTGNTAGQNIGYSSLLSATQMMTMWMNSPGHRSNILSANFSHLGIGCVKDRTNLVWWTQDFGG